MNVVFLDIDGVMQPFGWQKRHSIDLNCLQARLSERDIRFLDMDRYDIGAVYCDWAEISVQGLNFLCECADACIVISSTWRRSKSLDQLRTLFSIHGLDRWLIDETPQLDGATRSDEIKRWLHSHPEVMNFVILDDDYSREYEINYPGKYVTSRNKLSLNDIILALKVLLPSGCNADFSKLDAIDGYSVAKPQW